MADTTVEQTDVGAKASKLPMIIGLVLALLGGGGGFYAVQSGLLGFGGDSTAQSDAKTEPADAIPEDMPLGDIAFVEVPPVTISLGPNSRVKHLIFRVSLEVPSSKASEVESILPRIQDVLNGYLRALEVADIEAPGALIRIRSQLLRRVQMVAGEGRIRDLLVLEFVLN